MTSRSKIILVSLAVLILGCVAVWLVKNSKQRTQASDEPLPWAREVRLYDFPSRDAAERASIQRLAEELPQHTQDVFMIRWSLAKSGPALQATLFSREKKTIGYAADAYAGYESMWTNVDEAAIRALAAKQGKLEDLRPKDWPTEK